MRPIDPGDVILPADIDGTSPDVRTIVACAAEDDQVLLTHAMLGRHGPGWNILWAESPTSIPHSPETLARKHYHPETSEAALTERISHYIEGIPSFPSVVAVSRGGTVNVASNIIIDNILLGEERKTEIINLPDSLRIALRISREKIIVDNDATAAALGEACFGAGGQGNPAFAFILASKGTNVGLVLKNDVWEGALHPEAGHCLPRRHRLDDIDNFEGDCLVHRDCAIGMVSMPTILDRLSRRNIEEVTEIIGYYYAQTCMNLVGLIAPRQIVIGGLLLQSKILPNILASIQKQFVEIVGKYPAFNAKQDVLSFIKEGELGAEASLWGMVEMARRHMKKLEQ